MSDPLATYLHDHLSGAKAAIDLLEEMQDRHRDRPLAELRRSFWRRFRQTVTPCNDWRRRLGAVPMCLRSSRVG
jgi:hypothetical protein